jgi:Ca-activated chloride channel family protein
MPEFKFLHPYFLWLLSILPILVVWYFYIQTKSKTRLKVGNTAGLLQVKSWKTSLVKALPIFRLMAIAALILGIARPVSHSVTKKTKTSNGIDIVMAIDISASMLAKDLSPNRLESLKKVAVNFVNQRPDDRFGLVAYAGESFTKTPITSDHDIVIRNIKELNWGELEGGTAIGMGLGSAINRIKDSKAKSKVIILLTDGVNNSGFVDPKTAAEIAKEMGIKVYTIGLGTNGMALFPVARRDDGSLVFQNQPVEIDEVLLRQIAKETGGKYFRATSNTKLKAIYDEINQMETTVTQELKYENFDELYRKWVFLALGLLFLEFLLRKTIFKSFV